MPPRAEYSFHKHLELQSETTQIIHPISATPGFLTWVYRRDWSNKIPRKMEKVYAWKVLHSQRSKLCDIHLDLQGTILASLHLLLLSKLVFFCWPGGSWITTFYFWTHTHRSSRDPSLLHLSQLFGKKEGSSVCVSVWDRNFICKAFPGAHFPTKKRSSSFPLDAHTHLHPPLLTRAPLCAQICVMPPGRFSFSTRWRSPRNT